MVKHQPFPAGARTAAEDANLRLLEMAERLSGVGRWRYDLTSGRISWSAEVYRIHGVTPETFDPNFSDAIDFYHEDDRAAVRAFLEQVIADGEERSFQLRLRRPDGELRKVVSRACREMGFDGAPSAVCGVFQDVTDQVDALAKVRRAGDRYRLLADNMADVVARIRPDGASDYISPAIKNLLGRRPAEMIGLPAQHFVRPEDRDLLLRTMGTAVADGASQTVQLQALHKDGSTVPVECTFKAVADGPDGPEVVAVIRDVTERDALERALTARERLYRLIAENSTDTINQTDLESNILYVSPAVQRLTGYSPDELIGRKAYELIDPEDWPRVRREYAKLVHYGVDARVSPIEYRMVRKDGSRLWVEISPKVIWQEGEPVGFVDVVRDVEARKEAEVALRDARREAEAAAEAKADFLANMSHELRTPLTSIIGFSALVGAQQDLSPSARAFIARIQNAGRALLATVNDILDFSKLEAGQISVQPVPLDPRAHLADCLDLLEPQAAAKGLELRLEIGSSLPAGLLLDPDRTRQILLNYLSNAVKFTHTGSVTLRADYAAHYGRLTVSVIDTGAGIAPDKMDRLFVRFSQVNEGLARSAGGTGLGLAICKGLAEAMGGQVGVESRPDEGSRFWFDLPVAEASVSKPDADRTTAKADLAGTRVLVVDDHAANRDIARVLLQALGCAVDEACDGDAALAILSRRPFDVILLDLRLPGLEGPEILAALRTRPGPNQAVPVVAFTADADMHRASLASAGFDDVVGKPIMPEELTEALHRALSLPPEVAHARRV